MAAARLDEMAGAQSDEAALVRAAQADLAAFAPLYLHYRDRLYAYLRVRARSAEDAADLTQQVFVQALDALPRYRVGAVPFAAWLFRIARNTVANYHTRHRPTVAWDLIPESLHPATSDDLETRMLRREAIERVRALLATCKPGTREALALHFAAGLTVAETAAVLGKSEAAVKKHLYRAIRTLKEQYRESMA